MAVKASATITLTSYRDTQSVTRYYKLQPAGSSAPLKPETKPPSSDWTDSEPACDISKELYFCDLTIFSNGEWEYSKVSKSTSYEAAKEAFNRAQAAKDSIDNLEIGGRNLFIETDYENIETQGYVDARGWFQPNSIKSYIVDDNSEKAAKIAGNSWDLAQYVNVEAGETYTMSCLARLETERSGAKLRFQPDVLQIYYREFDKDLTTDYQKFTYTWTCGVGGIERIHIRTGNANDVLYVKKIKFEKGNRATDWTPAPEDVDAGIDNAAKVATNYLHYDDIDGLVLGNKESGSWVGYRTQIDTDSFNVLDENGNIIASYGSTEVELGKGNPSAIIKMCDGKAYVKNYIVGSQNTSVFCGQNVTVVGEWEGASEAYALFKQGFINIGQASSYIRLFNENDNMNQVVIHGQNIRMDSVSTIGNFDCYMKPRFFTMAGEIKMWAGDAIPDGWLLCDGSEVSKTDYPQLYKAIGDLWGTPNSSSNFKLPNLTGRVPVGYNAADTDTTETFGQVGATGGARGAWYHTHTIGSSGAHHHASQGRMEGSGTGANIFESYNGASKTRSVNVPRTGTNGNHTHSPGSSGSSGNKLAADKANMPPYAVVKYIICAF